MEVCLRSKRTSLRALLQISLLLAIFALAPNAVLNAAGPGRPDTQASSASVAQHDGVLTRADGSVVLSTSAAVPSSGSGLFSRHGILVQAPQTLRSPVWRVQVSYRADVPADTRVLVDVRGSQDGRSWSEWASGVADGAVIGFDRQVRIVQYRLNLFGTAVAGPAINEVRLAPTTAPADQTVTATAHYGVAPTFRIRATRQGMIGGRTANGYIIPPHARFVSLPCWCSLSTLGGDEYKVRITYRGRSTVVPVYDVGPYSGRDDYWNEVRRGYPELMRGWPQDHAAYYEGHNGGWADKGYVRFPTAMDVGDGAWRDDLGIVGDQAEVEVTFLWMGHDPLAGPSPRDPALGEHVVDELSGDFWKSRLDFGSSPVGCGERRHAYRTYSVVDPQASTHIARWQPSLPSSGLYDVYVHVPLCPTRTPPTTQARYVIGYHDGATELAVDQSRQIGWIYLGRFPFVAGTEGFVQLSDLAGDSGRTIWFDQAKWVVVP
jgi:hypothetical protein